MSRRVILPALMMVMWAGVVARAAVLDLDGRAHVLGSGRVTAVVFLNPECPIARKTVATINEVAAGAGDAAVIGVVSDPKVSRAGARTFVEEYGAKFPVVLDVNGELAARFKPGRTPEAFVVDRRGEVRYRGRVDDAFVSVGKARAVVTLHDLRDALAAVVAGKAVERPVTEAVGCVFEAWKDLGGEKSAVTYAREVAPILMANCVSCHRPGEVAPFSLLSYDDAAKRAEQIAEVVGKKLMPPWKAVAGYGHFADERRLSEREIDVIAKWAEAGAPKGDEAEMPRLPEFASGWTLGEPDLVVEMAEAFEVPAAGKDVYRAFVLPLDLPKDTYVAGFEFRPGAKSVVHHALFFLDTSGKARELDAKDAAPGYRSFGGPGFTPSGGLGGWAPGATPFLLADGTARFAPRGADLVMQMHYHPDGRSHADKSSIALYFAKKPVERVVHSIPLISRVIDIAPGDADYRRSVAVTLPEEVNVIGIVPHMHLIGREMKVRAVGPDGKETPLIHVPEWDFQWQDQYRYVEPIKLVAGTRLEMTAQYDNSASNPANPSNPPKRVTWGEQTTDEMCICFLQITLDDPSKLKVIRREIARQALVANVVGRVLGAGSGRAK